ncbi:hypothetical protein CaCOL14_009636 [Colletotrichum acutatum]
MFHTGAEMVTLLDTGILILPERCEGLNARYITTVPL